MKKLNMALMLAFINVMAFAQEKAVDANVDLNVNDGSGGGSFPWMYLIGAVLLIVLLFALLGGRGRDRIVEKRTVVKD
ncbi:hypothetical protein [Desertivirga xinjiangensis]|uniref:hypothetical protein n=1 Tax=Desertivirga xinjiangensis TaxID=539206 RepID=UPI00210E6421|nr:hypothetical protein [Pedobacter xinjiangensis]